MKGVMETSVNWTYVIVGLIIGIIILLLFLPVIFGPNVFSNFGKEVCLLTIGKLFGNAKLCETFI